LIGYFKYFYYTCLTITIKPNLMVSPIIKLALLDDHTLFREALRNYLTQQKNIEVTIHESSAFELLHKLKRIPADILLIDLFMPQLNGNDAIKIVRSEFPQVRVIVLSMCTDLQTINNLLDIGIHGYISKDDEPENLLQAIKAVSERRIYRNKLFTEALYLNKQNVINSVKDDAIIAFNERERKILQLLWDEKSNKEIANELFLSIRSIEKIRQDMKEKLGVKTTVGLFKYALKNKIIEEREVVMVNRAIRSITNVPGQNYFPATK